MNRILAGAIFLLSSTALAQSPEIINRQEQMLEPVVAINAGPSEGSGVVVYSSELNGEVITAVLTNFHVIQPLINPDDGTIREVYVGFARYNDAGFYVGTDVREGTVVSYDQNMDLALIVLNDSQTIYSVAQLATTDEPLYPAEDVWSVGNSNGDGIAISYGLLNFVETHSGVEYVYSSSPITHGNSGGGLFHRAEDGGFEMIGVPAMVGTENTQQNDVLAVHFQNYSVSIDVVWQFLNTAGLGPLIAQGSLPLPSEIEIPNETR